MPTYQIQHGGGTLEIESAKDLTPEDIQSAVEATTPAPVERKIAGRTVKTRGDAFRAILSGFTPGAVKESVFEASEPAKPVQKIVAGSEQAVRDAPAGSVEEKLALAGLFAGSAVAPLTAPAGVLGLGTTGLSIQVAKNAPKLLPLARPLAAGTNAAMAAPMAEAAGAMAGEASVEPTAANIGATLGTTAMAILGGLGVAQELMTRAPLVFKPGAQAAVNERAAQTARDTAARFEKAFQAESAAKNTRAADFLKAKAELHAQAAAEIEAALKQSQIGEGETTTLTGTPEQNQLAKLDTRPGAAAKERVRLAAKALAVDEGGLPQGVEPSAQVSRVLAEQGFEGAPPSAPVSRPAALADIRAKLDAERMKWDAPIPESLPTAAIAEARQLKHEFNRRFEMVNSAFNEADALNKSPAALEGLNARLADLEKWSQAHRLARAEEALQTAKGKTLGAQEETTFSGNAEKDQATLLDMRVGQQGARSERARLGPLSEQPPEVSAGEIPSGVQLSRQAQDLAASEGEPLPLAPKRSRPAPIKALADIPPVEELPIAAVKPVAKTSEPIVPAAVPVEAPTKAPAAPAPGPLSEASPVSANKLTYEDFSKRYTEAFNNANKYTPEQVGSQHFIDEMANLADENPEHLTRFEAEQDAAATRKVASAMQEVAPVAKPLPLAEPPLETFSKAAVKRQRDEVKRLEALAEKAVERDPTTATKFTESARLAREKLVQMEASPNAPGRGFSISTLPDGTPDLLNAIFEEGGVRPPLASSKGEYDNFAQTFSCTAKILVRKGGSKIDDLAKSLGFDDVEKFKAAVTRAMEVRKREITRYEAMLGEQKSAAQAEQFGKAIIDNEGRPKSQAGKPQQADSLMTGDKFKGKDELFEVVGVDENGDVIVKDGPKFGTQKLPAGSTFYPDKGTLRRVPRKEATFLDEADMVPEVVPDKATLSVEFGGEKYPVSSLDEAQKRFNEFRDKLDVGVSDMPGPVYVLDSSGKRIGEFSYNGRLWKLGENGKKGETELIASSAKPGPLSDAPEIKLESATLEQQAAEANAARELAKKTAERDALAAKAAKPLTGDSSNVGQGQLLAGDEDLFSGESQQSKAKREGAFVDPRLLLSKPVQGTLGATSGAIYGAGKGDTPEERRANMLKYGAAGALAGIGVGFGAKAILGGRAPSTKYRDYVKELAQGTEGMPAWYLKARTIEPIVKFREQFAGTGGSITRIKDVLAENPTDVPEAINPYLGRRLYPGKVTARIELDAEKPMDAIITNRDKAAVAWAKQTGGSRDDFNRRFQEYAVAKTAKDYNFHNQDFDPTKPASGMTDAEADAIILEAQQNGTAPVLEDLRRQLRVMDETYLDILRDGQLITQKDVDALRAKYPEHIPLQRVLDEADTSDAVGAVYATPKFGMKSAGIKGAYGSELPVADVFDSVLANVKNAMIRAERNNQGVITADYFEKYPTPGVTVKPAPVEGTRADGSPIFRKPNDNTTLITRRLNPKTDKINEIHVEFDDPLLAKAFNGLNVEKTQPIMRVISKMTNALGSLYTAGSLDFKLPNKLRDMQEAATTIATSGDTKAAAQIPLRALQDMKSVSDFMRGKATPGAAAYEAMKREGGFVGGLASSTREAADKSVKHMGLTGPLTRTVDAVKSFYEFLDKVSEDSTRLTAGRTAVGAGTTAKEAALASREAGVDFNLPGTGNKQLGAFYKFINPAVMGTSRMGKAVIRNPGTIGAAAAAFAGSGLIIDAWNKTFDPDWKKHRSMQWYRTNSMPLIIGEDAENYLVFTPPVAQMLRPVKGLVDIGIDASGGELTSGQDAAERARQIANDSMNPFGGSDFGQSITPTMADPLVDVWRNRGYTGSKITPEGGPQDPEFAKVRDRTLMSTSGQLAIDGSKMLNKMGVELSPEALIYLIKGYGGGPLQTATQAATLAKKAAGAKGDLTFRDIPVLGRFIHQIPKDSPITQGPQQSALGEVRDQAGEEKLALRKRTLEAIESFKNKSGEELAADLIRIKQTDPEMMKALTNELISGSKDPIESQLRNMNAVSRARYIDGQMKTMTPEQQGEYVKRLSTGPEPVITNDVAKELMMIIQQSMPTPAPKPTTQFRENAIYRDPETGIRRRYVGGEFVSVA
jgi:hypothetical protein